MRTKDDIIRIIDEEGVEFIRLQFTDVLGNLKNLAVTPGQIDRVVNNMYSFAGSAIYDGKFDYPDDLFLIPDLDSFMILPWRPQQGKVAKLICDVGKRSDNGKGVELFMDSPRTILKKVIGKYSDKGYSFLVNPECEFFLFHTDEKGRPTTVSHESAGYMDVGPADLGENARRDIVLALDEMGFEIESSHHEKAPGQHEIVFKEDESLKTADAVVTFKFAVRSVVKRFGLCATFMPKPVNNCAGSGMHLNFSLYKDGKNLFETDDGEISDTARHFIGGILTHAGALCAITNPTVNSYKRLLGGEGAPTRCSWSDTNNNSSVRYYKNFGEAKVELRFPDPAANPYLAIAAGIAAGMEGVENLVEPEPKNNQNAIKFPGNLNDSLRLFRKDEMLKRALGEEFVETYNWIRKKEWNDYMQQVSDWEIDRYLVNI